MQNHNPEKDVVFVVRRLLVKGLQARTVLARLFPLFVALLIVFANAEDSWAKQSKVFEEAQVKAVFLFNLTKFVTWPNSNTEALVDRRKNNTFNIGILGEASFGQHLKTAVKNETVKGKRIEVKQLNSQSDLSQYPLDLLFVGKKYHNSQRKIFSILQNKKILTVGDSKGFCQAGGMINLLTVGKRIKLEVNLEVVKQNDLRISAQVLKLARLVTTIPEED